MSSVDTKRVKLSEIFDFEKCKTNGSKFTKKIIEKHKGNIPVYGATQNKYDATYGYVEDNLIVNDKNINLTVKYFNDCITWNIDGSVGVFYRDGRFSLSEKVIPLILYDKYENSLNKDYLVLSIEKAISDLDFSRMNKGNQAKLKEVVIEIPVLEDGKYDLIKQKEIAEKYQRLERAKNSLLKAKKDVLEQEVNLDIGSLGYAYKTVKLKNIFNSKRGDSKYTKDYCRKHKGIYEVYTGTTVGIFGSIDTYDYEGDNLTFTTDGEYAGTVQILSGKYNIGGHRALLIFKNNNLDMLYLKFMLSILFKSLSKQGVIPSVNWNTIKDMTIDIPKNINGDFDIQAQKEIAEKYQRIEDIKKSLDTQVKEILNMNI